MPTRNPAQPSKPASSSTPPGPQPTLVADPSHPITTSLEPIAKRDFGVDDARHLLWRAGFGGSPAQIRTLVEWGPEKAVEHLVKYDDIACEPVKPDLFDRDIMRPATQEERMQQRRAASARDEETLAQLRVKRQNAEQNDREQIRAMQRWWLKRMIETGRPLEEKLTLFWHGHFATSYRTVEDSYHMFVQNQMFRKNAAGNFGDMLYAIIRDPAMIAYLNNNDSKKGKPNENLAREIMELFSLGVGAYGESDIKEGARALTGYTFKDDDFEFERNNHDTGVKNILGRSAAMNGDDFVRTILEQRACSRFIATKLYRFFVHDFPSGSKRIDEPAQQVIGELASSLLASRYELRPVLRKLFLSRHFYDPAIRNEQIKSPVQLVVGAIRSLGTPARDLNTLLDACNRMGQNIMHPPSVKGWDGGRSWINTSTMFVRQNTLVYLITGKRPQGKDGLAESEKFDGPGLVAQLADAYAEARSDSPDERVDAILRFAAGRADVGGREALMDFYGSHAHKLEGDAMTDLMLLVTAMPEYQLC